MGRLSNLNDLAHEDEEIYLGHSPELVKSAVWERVLRMRAAPTALEVVGDCGPKADALG